MRWSNKPGSTQRRHRRISLALLAIGVASVMWLTAADERHISVYSSAASYTLPVNSHGGHDYVGLFDILEPLGTISAHAEGTRWKVRYNGVDGEFVAGKSRGKIGGRDFELPGKFLLENNRGLLPVASLPTVMPRFLGGPVTFREASRRLFIGNVAIHFTAQVNQAQPPGVVMNFSGPVNPSISTEPGKLQMVFRREAVVPPGSETLTFNSNVIPSATYREENGAVEIDVTGTVPLFASFSNGGRTITISAAPQTAASQPAAISPGPQANTTPGTVTPPPAPIGGLTPPVRFVAVVDASHGGDERGAALTDQLAEKDVTLALARRVRVELESHGVTVQMVRDSDVTVNLDQRAAVVNTTHPAIYICIHAASSGSGVRLYTAALPQGGDSRGPFVDWDTAQSSFLPASQMVQNTLAGEFRRRLITTRTLAAPLRPLNNVTAPAVAIEVAPSSGSLSDLTSAGYQQLIASSIAAAVTEMRDKLEAGR